MGQTGLHAVETPSLSSEQSIPFHDNRPSCSAGSGTGTSRSCYSLDAVKPADVCFYQPLAVSTRECGLCPPPPESPSVAEANLRWEVGASSQQSLQALGC